MTIQFRFLIGVGTVLSLTSVAAAVAGTATYYSPHGPTACYGPFGDKGLMAAASDAIWDKGAACGRRYSVRCTGATNGVVSQPCKGTSVNITIVDYCPPGCLATIDLSQEAFSIIADLNAGKIRIEYTRI